MTKQFAHDYIDVAERIREFRALYPEGTLQPAEVSKPYRIETVTGDTYIVVVAAAYRHPDDPKPGIGMAYEPYPGKTPFTRGSELQNAETSAWGRAIIAALAGDTKRGIASAQEIRNRQAERNAPPPNPGRLERINAELVAVTTNDELELMLQKLRRSWSTYTHEEAQQIQRWVESTKIRLTPHWKPPNEHTPPIPRSHRTDTP